METASNWHTANRPEVDLTMQLYISRTCRNDGWVWDSWVYSITCTLGMDEDEYAICSSHGLLEMWVWHSEALVEHYDNAYEGFDTAANTPLFPQNGMLEWYGQILHSFTRRALAEAARLPEA